MSGGSVDHQALVALAASVGMLPPPGRSLAVSPLSPSPLAAATAAAAAAAAAAAQSSTSSSASMEEMTTFHSSGGEAAALGEYGGGATVATTTTTTTTSAAAAATTSGHLQPPAGRLPLWQEQVLGLLAARDSLLHLFRDRAFTDAVQKRLLPAVPAEARDAFEIILGNCTREAEQLETSKIKISIHGAAKTGKSTFCNAIAGRSLLPVSQRPCTAVPCMMHTCSGERPLSGQVVFAEGTDMETIFAAKEAAHPELPGDAGYREYRERLRELRDLSYQSRAPLGRPGEGERGLLADVHLLAKPPYDFRDVNARIVSRLEVNAPMLGFRNDGLVVIDAPGSNENPALDFVCRSTAQTASIIFYVTDVHTSAVPADDLNFLRRQAAIGSDIMFVFNRRQSDGAEEVREAVAQIARSVHAVPAFAAHAVYQLDALQALQGNLFFASSIIGGSGSGAGALDPSRPVHRELIDFRVDLGERVLAAAKKMIAQFSRSLFHLLRATQLVLSHTIFLSILPKEQKLELAQRFSKERARIESDIAALSKAAEAKLGSYRREFEAMFVQQVEALRGAVLTRAEELTVRAPFDAAPPFSARVTGRVNDDFKRELFQQLSEFVEFRLTPQLIDWALEKRAHFAEFIYTEGGKIQDATADVLRSAARSSVHPRVLSVFSEMEAHISDFGRVLAITTLGPVSMIAASGGVGLAAASVLLGAISSAVVTGGISLVLVGSLGLAVTGVFARDTFSTTSQADTRRAIANDLLVQLRSLPSQAAFRATADGALRGCINMRDFVRDSLVLGMREMLSLSDVLRAKPLPYAELCRLLYIREEFAGRIFQLNEILRTKVVSNSFAATATAAAATAADPDAAGMQPIVAFIDKHSPKRHSPTCFVCQKSFRLCGHICAQCVVQLGDSPCPYCNRWSFLLHQSDDDPAAAAAVGDGGGDKHPAFLDIQGLEDDDAHHLETMLVHTAANEEQLLARLLERNQEAFRSFNSWFTGMVGGNLLSTDAAFRSVEVFSSKFAAVFPLMDVARLIAAVHKTLSPEIFHSLRLLLAAELAAKDAELDAAIALECHQLRPADWRRFLELELPVHGGDADDAAWAGAVEQLQLLAASPLPMAKLACLQRCVREIEGCMAAHRQLLTGDSLAEAFVYLAVRARVPQLLIEAEMLYRSVRSFFLNSMEDYLLTTLLSVASTLAEIIKRQANKQRNLRQEL